MTFWGTRARVSETTSVPSSQRGVRLRPEQDFCIGELVQLCTVHTDMIFEVSLNTERTREQHKAQECEAHPRPQYEGVT